MPAPSSPSPAIDPPIEPPAAAAPAKPLADVPLEDVDVRPYLRRDPWPKMLLRRGLSMPLLLAFTVLWWALFPLALPILVVVDLVKRRPFLWCRFYVMIGTILFGHVWGILLLFSMWLSTGFGLAWRTYNRRALWAESIWAAWNARVMARIYAITYDVEGSEVMRHVSINDTILPISLVTSAHGVRLRIVLKAELLYVPIVDVIGHTIPFAFVRRSSSDPSRELATVRAFTGDLHPRESIMIFPEGTRFSEERRAGLIARMRDKDPAIAAIAEELTHVLPLRFGGMFALMDAVPHADIVFCAHTGYERTVRLADFVAGGLYRAVVKVKFWRVAAAAIPRDPDARVRFFQDEWRKVNAWVATHQAVRA
jgi:hypothetical protein